MKNTVLPFLVFLGMITSSANASAEIKSFKSVNANFNDTTSSATIPDADALLQEIMAITGLQQNFELKAADVINIEATIQHKKRYILYNPDFISKINRVTKNKWAAQALIAHEVGHHLNGHTIRKTGSNKKDELEADEFAGFILHKLGATLQQAQMVMLLIAKKEDSKTHPAQDSRLEAIKKGWDKATPPSQTTIQPPTP